MQESFIPPIQNRHQTKHAPSLGTLVEITVDALQLKIAVSDVVTGRINTMFTGHELNKYTVLFRLGIALVTNNASCNERDINKYSEKEK